MQTSTCVEQNTTNLFIIYFRSIYYQEMNTYDFSHLLGWC
jgi:hypothetical protein